MNDYQKMTKSELIEILRDYELFMNKNALDNIPVYRRFFASKRDTEVVAYQDPNGRYVIESDVIPKFMDNEEFREAYQFLGPVPVVDMVVEESKNA